MANLPDADLAREVQLSLSLNKPYVKQKPNHAYVTQTNEVKREQN